MATALKSSTSLEKTGNKKILGQGGYGIVYEDIWNGKKVAVKRILFETLNNEREEEALTKLEHPNVVKLFHVAKDENFKYYALEFCHASLEKLFLKDDDPQKYRGPMPSENQVFLQLARGLGHIHEKGMIHQNLKPENVLIYERSDGKEVTMKWSGFGLCKPVNERGTYSISEVKGPFNWLAPEILKLLNDETENDEKKRVTIKSDVFAEGLVFGYYLLGGKHPYGSNIQIMQNILENNPVNLNGITERRPIHEIIKKMLKTNPHERISSFGVIRKISNIEEGVTKTKLFAFNLAAALEKSIKPAFEKEIAQKTFKGIRNERWLYDRRHMQKHMDLYLIELLEDQQLDKVLDHIGNPKEFYAEVLHRLIAENIVNVDDEWQSFLNHLIQSITQAAVVKVGKGRAQTFVDQLRKEFLEGYLQSETLGSAFVIDCSDEYEDCDNEDPKEFQNACLTELMQVLEEQISIQDEKNSAKELSSKVVRYMITLNDKAALPRCEECCYMCKGLCIEAANHDTKEKPHDAIHQPGGVAGLSYRGSLKLISTTCNQSYEEDEGLNLSGDYTYTYRDYAKVFPGWKDPRINEELPLREYILATYNKEIAKKYNLKPADDIPASYSRNLSSIKERLKRDIANC